MRSHDPISQCDSTMQSHDSARFDLTMQSLPSNHIRQFARCDSTVVRGMQSSRYNLHGEICPTRLEASARFKNEQKSHFSKLKKAVRTTETRVFTPLRENPCTSEIRVSALLRQESLTLRQVCNTKTRVFAPLRQESLQHRDKNICTTETRVSLHH